MDLLLGSDRTSGESDVEYTLVGQEPRVLHGKHHGGGVGVVVVGVPPAGRGHED